MFVVFFIILYNRGEELEVSGGCKVILYFYFIIKVGCTATEVECTM